jgi:hypothetical protein
MGPDLNSPLNLLLFVGLMLLIGVLGAEIDYRVNRKRRPPPAVSEAADQG